jgi:hypothetical protein
VEAAVKYGALCTEAADFATLPVGKARLHLLRFEGVLRGEAIALWPPSDSHFARDFFLPHLYVPFCERIANARQ